jgi:hypothetical protein
VQREIHFLNQEQIKKVAIIQSNYIPWKGYFDIINQVDEFILLDDVQYTRRDWRNRNLIKTPQGLKWLTIPVQVKGNYSSLINEIKITDSKWCIQHWNQIEINYSKAPFFDQYADRLKKVFTELHQEYLSEINLILLREIAAILNIETPISLSTNYVSEGTKSQKLISLCQSCGASSYLSGPSAKAYLDETMFEKENITVEWVEYNGYPEYTQLYPPFEHGVTILDLLFNTGPDSRKYMKSFL